MSKEIYSLTYKCLNCGKTGVMDFEKGNQPYPATPCPHCEVSFRLRFGDDPTLNVEKFIEKFR